MNAIFLTFWGKKYSNDFLHLFLPCLNENLKILKNKKKKYRLEIWTLEKDANYIKKNKLFKSISKKIDCYFRSIDFIIKESNINKFNKYELHETISYIFKTSKCFQYQYLWFFYPDQFFSKKFISNISNLTKKKKVDLVFMPSLLCQRKKIYELFKSKKIFKDNFRKIYLSTLDKSNKYVNIKYINNYQFLKVVDIYKKSLIIKSFHTHPLLIRTKNNFEGLRYPFYPSHDEGIASFFAKKNIHVIKNLKSGILASASQVTNSPLILNNSMKKSIFSGMLQFNETHLKSSEQTFVDGNENSKKFKEKIKKVNNKINFLRNGYKTLLKNLNNYPNVKENKYFKSKDYPSLIDKIIDFEIQIQKFYNQKLINYNKKIFDYFLKYSQFKTYNKKISFNEFFLKFLNTNNQKDIKYHNFLVKMYFK
tara:strand:+ start:2767 stop:4032 length:1266 start_codon:yes stop_codon:yes gene_type:complete